MYNRVRSIGIAYEQLYSSESVSEITVSRYIRNLVDILSETYRTDKRVVTTSVNANDVSVDIDTAVLCGMIINELVSNSLKHAFSGRREGKIFVNIRSLENKVVLIIGDNGIGMLAEIDPDLVKSLGLKIVKILVKQLDATIVLDRKSGTVFTIEFPR